ncbi:MAG: endonuclease/exonuclease/phosphatase family protein [Clostridia bacterium]|nr:endonuclease/exonuclease/phosphatase family protein [Clostridia bacterium]MBP5237666.1 endonuclease/exonuclease/phosphatase family protein [Clostridia bacterium]MBP5755421.1 endonuclease/exonuclease/phosphatase family protein [Clostridia bacterium]
MRIKIMSFNIQHCRNYNFPLEDRIDFDVTANAIRKYDPDIVGLQEVRGKGESSKYTDQAPELAARTEMFYAFAPAFTVPHGGPYGNALLSKYPILDVKTILIPVPDTGYYCEPRCILRAVLDIGRPVTVFVTHFGLKPPEAENASASVVEALAGTSTPKILMGDFNLTPESPILDPIRISMADTADVFDSPKLSFPSDAPTQKIDYIFVSEDFNIISADIPEIVASDHRPYLAELEL